MKNVDLGLLFLRLGLGIDKSYAKGKKIRTGKSMGQIALRALF